MSVVALELVKKGEQRAWEIRVGVTMTVCTPSVEHSSAPAVF